MVVVPKSPACTYARPSFISGEKGSQGYLRLTTVTAMIQSSMRVISRLYYSLAQKLFWVVKHVAEPGVARECGSVGGRRSTSDQEMVSIYTPVT